MDIRAVDLNLLKAFDALMSERAVTRAAGRIGLSQPAMSYALSRLRNLFADDLFVRTPDRMEPTARAREIAPLVSAAIEHIEAALNLGVGFDPAKSARDLYRRNGRVCRGRPCRPACRKLCPAKPPKATLRLTPVTGAEAAEQLESGAIDVAVAHLRVLPAHIESVVLLHDPFVLIARRGHPLAAPSLSIEAYAALDHVLVVATRRYQRRGRPCACGFRVEAAASRCWSRPTWRCRRCSRLPISSLLCHAAPHSKLLR